MSRPGKYRSGSQNCLILTAAMLGWVTGPDAEARATPAHAIIPIAYEEARAYVPVSSAKGSLGWFILDTGASETLIDAGLRQAAGVEVLNHVDEHGAGQGKLDVGKTGAAKLFVGGSPLSLKSTEVAALDHLLAPYSGRRVGGIIGGEFFHTHVVTIDFARRTLVLHDPATYAYHGFGVRLPFQFVNGVPIAVGAITLSDGTNLPLRLLVDLGAKANLLVAGPFVEDHQLLTKLAPSVVEPLGAGLGGETRYAFTRLPKLVVGLTGGISSSSPLIGLSVNGTLRGGYYDALLGAAFLQHYRVTIDYARQQIIFEPNPHAISDRFDRSGAFLVSEQTDLYRFIVQDIVPNSPAAEAGLQVGDVLKTIHGRPASRYTLSKVRRLLASTNDQPVPVTILRGGQTVDVVLRLRQLFD